MRNILLLIAYTLLALPFLLNARSAKRLFAAARSGQNLQRIRSEVRKGASINAYNKEGFTPLMVAVQNNNVAAARTLLEEGAQADKTMRGTHETALMMAAKNGGERMIRLLLNNKYSPADKTLKTSGKHQKTAYDIAQIHGHTNIVGLLR